MDYVSGTTTNTLLFNYTIAAGQNSADLDFVNIASLVFNGGTIVDGASNSATLTLPTPGAAGSLGANKALVIDTIAPGFLTDGALATASDTGFSSSDNITTDTTPTIEGTGVEANATVKLYLDGITLVCTTTADASGNWSCTVPVALVSGTNNIHGSQTDLAGNESIIV